MTECCGEGEHVAVPMDLMQELFRLADESTARSTRVFDGEAVDDAMWCIPEFGGEW